MIISSYRRHLCMHIYDRMKAGEPIRFGDPDYRMILEGYDRAARLTAVINSGYHSHSEMRELVGRLTCSEVSEDVVIIAPLYSDWG